MTENISDHSITPLRSFYEGLSEDERCALAEAEGWDQSFGDQLVAVATLDVSEQPIEDIIERYDYVTFLKFTTESGVEKYFSFMHQYAVDLRKTKPVVYGFSNDALVGEWTAVEWMYAKDTAISQAMAILDESSRRNLQVQYAQFGFGHQITS